MCRRATNSSSSSSPDEDGPPPRRRNSPTRGFTAPASQNYSPLHVVFDNSRSAGSPSPVTTLLCIRARRSAPNRCHRHVTRDISTNAPRWCQRKGRKCIEPHGDRLGASRRCFHDGGRGPRDQWRGRSGPTPHRPRLRPTIGVAHPPTPGSRHRGRFRIHRICGRDTLDCSGARLGRLCRIERTEMSR